MAEYAVAHGLACSVGRTGVCWDNAQQESYWASLKVEFYDRHSWATRAEAMTAVADWIERVYNRRRRHSALRCSARTVRRAPPSDGRSRLTRRPPSGVKPKLMTCPVGRPGVVSELDEAWRPGRNGGSAECCGDEQR